MEDSGQSVNRSMINDELDAKVKKKHHFEWCDSVLLVVVLTAHGDSHSVLETRQRSCGLVV